MLISEFSYAQKNISWHYTKDSRYVDSIAVGSTSLDDFLKNTSYKWLNKKSNIKVEKDQLMFFKNHGSDYQFKCFIGTWCSDTHIMMPELISFFKKIKYNFSNVRIIMMDRSKQALNNEKANFDIQYLPTIIIYKNEIEIGRIIEVTKHSVSQDIFNIIHNKN